MNTGMNIKAKRFLRALLYTLGGALVGLAMYYLVGCSGAFCPITSNLLGSVVIMSALGFMLSGTCCGCMGGSCSIYEKKPPAKTEGKDSDR